MKEISNGSRNRCPCLHARSRCCSCASRPHAPGDTAQDRCGRRERRFRSGGSPGVPQAQQQTAAAQQQTVAAQQQAAAAQQQAAAAEKDAAAARQALAVAQGVLLLGTVVRTLPAGCASTPIGGCSTTTVAVTTIARRSRGNNLVYVTTQPKQ